MKLKRHKKKTNDKKKIKNKRMKTRQNKIIKESRTNR